MYLKTTNFLILCLLAFQLQAQTVIYINATATGLNNGTSWTDAYNNLQDALDASISGDELWVATDIYFPTKDKTGGSTPANNRDKTFFIDKDLSIYGGFAGTETTLSQRTCSPATTTTLSFRADLVEASNDNDTLTPAQGVEDDHRQEEAQRDDAENDRESSVGFAQLFWAALIGCRI